MRILVVGLDIYDVANKCCRLMFSFVACKRLSNIREIFAFILFPFSNTECRGERGKKVSNKFCGINSPTNLSLFKFKFFQW